MTVEEAKQILQLSGCLFGYDPEDEDDDPKMAQTLNMNDTFGWALAFGEYIPDDKLVEVAQLYNAYGYCGLVYWVSERNKQKKSEFQDINRYIEFVRNERKVIELEPNWDKRGYYKYSYQLG